jgi:hypothetical protein
MSPAYTEVESIACLPMNFLPVLMFRAEVQTGSRDRARPLLAVGASGCGNPVSRKPIYRQVEVHAACLALKHCPSQEKVLGGLQVT